MARILFTFAGGEGHLRPLLPLAAAADVAGHDVLVTGAGNLAARTALPYAPSGPDVVAIHAPLVPFDLEREHAALRRSFAGWFTEERIVDLRAVAREFRPDAIVRDETDFAAALLARELGVRHALVHSSAHAFVPAEIRDEFPAPDVVLTPFPPELRPGGLPFRAYDVPPARGGDSPLAGGAAVTIAGDGPVSGIVLVTLGTIFNTESGDLFERVLAGLDGEVLVAVGPTRHPAGLGPQPARVRVERHVDLAAVLPRARAVVCHAGSGTLLAALAHGVPLVLLPIGADQPGNARRAVELGAAIALDPLTATPDEIAAAVRAAPGLRPAAARLRRAIAVLPPPDAVLAAIQG
jgi:UDP:flavonoid glycosyltransferase YjiC (YdhE family)